MAKGYGEAMALLEAGKQIGMAMAKADEPKRPQRTEKKEKPPSWEQLWQEEQQRRDKFDNFMKVLKKQMAEEKKEEKKPPFGLDVDKVALLLLAMVPLNWAVLYWMLP